MLSTGKLEIKIYKKGNNMNKKKTGYGMIWCGLVWSGMAWHDMVWYGMWNGVVCLDVVWYGMV